MCRAMRDRVQRLQAVHDKFRAVVDEGERMPSTWSEAKPQHRQAFENFFAGWKPLPPSMSQPQRKLQTRAPADGTTRGGARRGPAVKVEDAPVVRSPGCVAARVRAGTLCLSDVEYFSNMVAVVQTRATTSTRSRSTAQHKAPPVPAKAADALVEEPKKTPAVQAAPPAETQQPAPASAQAMDNAQPTSAAAPMHPLSVEPADVPACMGMMGIADVSQLRAWAVMNGLGPAVPMTSPQAQAHAVASLAAHSQQLALMQLQMHTGFGAGAVLPAAAAALSSPVRPVTRSFAGFQLNSVVPQTS